MASNLPRGGFTVLDYDGETSKMGFAIERVTALTIASFLAVWGSLRSAVEGVSLGVVQSEYADIFNTRLNNMPPSDANAQRERKWLVRYQDATQFLDVANTIANPNYMQVDSFEIPCADVSLLQAGTDKADPTNTAVLNLVNLVEQMCRTKFGTALEVIEIRLVGRNS